MLYEIMFTEFLGITICTKEKYGQKQMEGAVFHIVHLLLFYDFLSVDYIHSLCKCVDVGPDKPSIKCINPV